MSRTRTFDVVFAGLAFAVLYFLLRSVGQTPDGLSYALAARTGTDLYHPHHILYVPVTRFLFLLTGSRDAILAGVLHNLIWMVALGFGAWRLALNLRWSHAAALLAACALLASRGVLFYSTHVETYLPALACLTLFTATWFKPQRSDLEASAWLALAVLYHQTNVLLVVPILLTSDRLRPDFIRVVLPAGAAVLGLYIAGWIFEGGETGFFPWLLTYAQADVPAWGSLSHFSWSGLSALGLSQMRQILPVQEFAADLGAVVLLVLLAGLTRHHLGQTRFRRERRFALAYLAVYLPFFLWWIPSDPDFFLATLLPLWMLALLLLADLNRRWQSSWLVVPVVLLLVGNLWFTARPLSRDPGLAHWRALQLSQVIEPGTAVVVGYGLEQEVLYYTAIAEVFEGEALGLKLAAGEVARWPSGPVLVGRGYLQVMLPRFTPADEILLQALLEYNEAEQTCRAHRFLPDGLGLLISEERQPADLWPVLCDRLAQNVAIHLLEETRSTSH